MSDIQDLINKIIKFRDVRDWKQFHNPKDSAMALSLEASEVLEQFLWLSKEEMEVYVKKHKKELGDELSDVLFWVLLMSFDLKIDITKAFNSKMRQNNKKYAVKKAKGKHLKYTAYQK
jgi:NTP pyrophosphatase (non-canonical NTP hydrolase)